MSDSFETPVGVDRRDFIKRGAIVGGMVWAAPLVQSLGSPAFAQGGTNGDETCTTFYNFKVEKEGENWTFVGCSLGAQDCETTHWDQGVPNCVQHVSGTPSSVTGQIGQYGTMTITFGEDGKTATIAFGDDKCQLLDGDAKAGLTCTNFVPDPDGDVYVVNTGTFDISNIVGTVCC
jgi:hypothetical protein